MKHLKIIGLALVAAAALMAFAGSASAATFTAPAGTTYTGALSSSLESGSSALLKAGFAEITCTSSTVAGSITTNNETEASGSTSSVAFSSCGSATVTTLSSKGTLKINKSTHAVSGTGTEVTVSLFGTDCVYGMGTGTTLGTATNSASGVTLAIKTKLPLLSSNSFLCANPAEWTANYIVTSPTGSVID